MATKINNGKSSVSSNKDSKEDAYILGMADDYSVIVSLLQGGLMYSLETNEDIKQNGCYQIEILGECRAAEMLVKKDIINTVGKKSKHKLFIYDEKATLEEVVGRKKKIKIIKNLCEGLTVWNRHLAIAKNMSVKTDV